MHHFREDQNKPAHIPFKACIHPHRAGTCKPEASHCPGVNRMKSQRRSQGPQHSYVPIVDQPGEFRVSCVGICHQCLGVVASTRCLISCAASSTCAFGSFVTRSTPATLTYRRSPTRTPSCEVLLFTSASSLISLAI